MPNLAGYNDAERAEKEAAIEALELLGFKDVVIEEEYNDEVEAGYVISQTPVYKTNYKYNVTEKVTLVISKGQKMVTLPKIIEGKKSDDVISELEELEVKYELIEQHDEEIEAGIVISVEPEEGEEITAATIVKLTVSKGSAFKDVEVPQLLGKTESEAKQALESVGLIPNISYEENTAKSDGVVTAQSIANGKIIKEGTEIEVTVNKLPEEATVTINLNLKSILAYTEPVPETKTEVDEFGNTVETTVTKEIESAKVEIYVGDDKIEDASYKKNKTNISKTWRTSGVKKIRVIIDGVTRFTQNVDFNKGDQVVEVK